MLSDRYGHLCPEEEDGLLEVDGTYPDRIHIRNKLKQPGNHSRTLQARLVHTGGLAPANVAR